MKKNILLFFTLIIKSAFAQQILWTDTISYYDGTGGGGRGNLIFDQQGNVYLSGQFGYIYNTSFGFYFNKYNPSGNLLQWDTISVGQGTSIYSAGGAASSQYLYSAFRCTSNFKMDNVIYPGQTYIVKRNNAGQVLWALPQNNEMPYHITTDRAGNLYVASDYVVKKYNSSGMCTQVFNSSGYIALDSLNNLYVQSQSIRKYSPSGTLLWTYPNIMPNSQMTVDASGNCYVHQGDYNMTSELLKINSTGQLEWIKPLSFDGSYGICLNKNYIYIAGIYGANQTMEGIELHKFNSKGDDLWSYQIYTGGYSLDQYKPVSILADSSGLYMAAVKTQNVYTFLFKIKEINTTITGLSAKKDGLFLNVSPNPSPSLFNISLKGEPASQIKVRDALGKVIYTKNVNRFSREINESVDLSGFPKGIYFLELNGENFKETRKLIVE
jgi:hypothetical protein